MLVGVSRRCDPSASFPFVRRCHDPRAQAMAAMRSVTATQGEGEHAWSRSKVELRREVSRCQGEYALAVGWVQPGNEEKHPSRLIWTADV